MHFFQLLFHIQLFLLKIHDYLASLFISCTLTMFVPGPGRKNRDPNSRNIPSRKCQRDDAEPDSNALTIASNSGSKGASTVIRCPREGKVKSIVLACKNMRFNPKLRTCLLNSGSPYLSSAAIGCP